MPTFCPRNFTGDTFTSLIGVGIGANHSDAVAMQQYALRERLAEMPFKG